MDNQAGEQKPKQRRVADRERKRAVRACDGCRRQKEKCDGGVPCRRCIRLRRQCEFHGPTIRQSIPGLEPGIRPQIQPHDNADAAQRLAYMEKLLSHYVGNDVPMDTDNLRGMVEAIEKDQKMDIVEQQPGSPGTDYLENEDGNVDEVFTVKALGNNITHYSGEFSHWNFSMRIKQWIEQCVPEHRNENGEVPNFKEYYRAEELQSPSGMISAIGALPPRYVADFLVQAFFTHAETNYFYVEKGWLLEKLEIAYEHSSAFTRRDVGTVCIIFIVLAIGTQYAYLDSLTENGGDQTQGGSTGPFSEDAIGVMFYQQACKLVPDVITLSSLESVQACLLIGIYTLPLDASGLSYIYLNLAVKLAVQNGMHRKYPNEGLDPVVHETRNRVWWTAYTTERRVGIFHGRPTSISGADVDTEMPIERSDIWPQRSSVYIAAMLATLQLHQLLARISQEISTLKVTPKQGPGDTMNRLVELKNDLHKWWGGLPNEVFCKNPPPHAKPSRSDMHLKLEWCLVRMFTGRPFIFLRMPSRSSASSTSSPNDLPHRSSFSSSTRKLDSKSILVADCVEASLTVIDTCKLLRNTIGLARASYTEFSACRAALLVIITQCLQEKTERLRQCLRDGVSMIKLMSAGGESARSEASLIELFERAISRLDASFDNVASSSESDYARFKKWEMLWKNDSPGTTDTRGGPSMPETPAPIPPPLSNLFSGPGPFDRNTVPGMTPATAVDWNFASFPQTMDEFSSMFGHSGFGPSPGDMSNPNGLNGGGHAWMGP
ncbi:unnamed protein product [Clonostachys rosea]|uniref:Zn(2)-C6 fungal-type domain-containing protein n=1 Tax=Bionectria ochroleuca TaxID=29856 RepID=A0ABY6UA25_BIOOC|nr:unnamed protein product [Clonostachys rosea]